MVLMNKRILTIVLLVIAAATTSLFFIITRDNDNGNETDQEIVDVQVQQAQEDQVRMDKFESIAENAESEDYSTAAQSSYDLARDDSAFIIMRLQSYSSCIYYAELAGDRDLKDVCYNQGLELSSEIEDQEGVVFWQRTLEEQYTGISSIPASGGDSIADENAAQ